MCFGGQPGQNSWRFRQHSEHHVPLEDVLFHLLHDLDALGPPIQKSMWD